MGFLFFPMMSMGLGLAALRTAGIPLSIQSSLRRFQHDINGSQQRDKQVPKADLL